jgi:glycosyltransferase involved in cell wall biosynthesis
MTRAPISMCLIARDEESNIETCLQSFRDFVEEIIVVDTGSIDKTVELAKKYADKVETYNQCNDEEGRIEDFSMARNYSLSLRSPHIKWGCWIDSDDVLIGGENLINYTNKFSNSNDPLFLQFPYEYSFDQNGNCNLRHYRERLFYLPDNFNFVSPCHEVCIAKEGRILYNETHNDIIWRHRRQYITKHTPSNRNLRILEKWYEKHGEIDARQLYYLGLEYGNANQVEKSKQFLHRYLELSGWDDEKWMALDRLINYYMNERNFTEVINHAFKAIQLKETWGEAYFALAKAHYFMAEEGKEPHLNWQRCANYAKMGLSFPPTQTLLFVNPNERNIEIHRYLNMALNKIGDIQGALDSCDSALKHLTNDPNLNQNKKVYENFLDKQVIHNRVIDLFNRQALNEENKDEVLKLIENPQKEKIVEQIGVVAEERKELVLPEKKEGKLDIVFYLGPALEPLNPAADALKAGGSEVMAVEIAKRFAAQGNAVRVYTDCGNMEGTYDGVAYINHEHYHNLRTDVLIASRMAHALDPQFDIQAKLKAIWTHDIFPKNMEPKYAEIADIIFVLSKWHKEFVMSQFPYVKQEKIIITRNGIDLTRFDQQMERDQYKCIVSSSPDRYLPSLLNMWPQIKERCPKASLHIMYGFFNWRRSAELQKDQGQINLIDQLEQKIKSMEPLDVYNRGRIGQQELAKEFLSSGVWPFSSWFSETYCISAAECQAAGVRMITSNVAALKETVSNRGVLIDGDWLSRDYQDKFVEETVKALNNSDNSDRVRLQEYARNNFGLDGVCESWNDIFRERLGLSQVSSQIKDITPYQSYEGFEAR